VRFYGTERICPRRAGQGAEGGTAALESLAENRRHFICVGHKLRQGIFQKGDHLIRVLQNAQTGDQPHCVQKCLHEARLPEVGQVIAEIPQIRRHVQARQAQKHLARRARQGHLVRVVAQDHLLQRSLPIALFLFRGRGVCQAQRVLQPHDLRLLPLQLRGIRQAVGGFDVILHVRPECGIAPPDERYHL